MRFWLDIEASSLTPNGYPIEIGWVGETDIETTSILVKPEAGWSDWSPASEGLHGITRNQLLRDGRACREVAELVTNCLGGAEVYSDDTIADQRWLNKLFAAAEMECPIRLIDSSRGDVLACISLIVIGRRQSAQPAETLAVAQPPHRSGAHRGRASAPSTGRERMLRGSEISI